MKKEQLIGLHCRTDLKLGPTGIVKDIIQLDDEGFDDEPIFEVVIEDPRDGDIERADMHNVIFEVPIINKWEFEYYNSHYEIDGDEKYLKDTLWLDVKLSKDEVIKIISEIYSGNDYFSLRNLKIIDNKTIDWQVK